MIKTPLSTMIGGAFWTPKATILGGDNENNVIPSTFEPMLVTPSDFNISISSASDLEIDWGDGTIQTVKSDDDITFETLGLISNRYTHSYTDGYDDKIISIKHLDGESPIQFLSSIGFKTVQRWYSEGYLPFKFFNDSISFDQDLAFYILGMLLDTVPNTAPPKTTHLSGMFIAASVFNQDISGWDVSNVTNMSNMFNGCDSFAQDLSQWCVPLITSLPSDFATDAPLFTEDKHPVWGTCPSGESALTT